MAGLLDYNALANFIFKPAEWYNAQAPKAPPSMGIMGDIHNAIDPVQAFGGYGGLTAMALPPGKAPSGLPVLRRAGAEVGEDLTALSRQGHVYRGMTKTEFDATVGSGNGIKSRGDYSHSSEGTSFAEDVPTAESYANYGHTDPRKTGTANYLIEAKRQPSMSKARDGYFKTKEAVPDDQITRIWEMLPDNTGNLIARLIRGK